MVPALASDSHHMPFHAKARRINTQHHQQVLSSIAMRHPQRHASAACTHGHDIRLQGMYEASFTPEVAGLYGINAVVHGAPIRGCPLRVKVLADETLAKNCRCFGGGMAHAVAGEPTSFTIQAVDGRGVARKSGGDVFDISITGPEDDAPHAATIRDNAEGTYVVTWAGKYSGCTRSASRWTARASAGRRSTATCCRRQSRPPAATFRCVVPSSLLRHSPASACMWGRRGGRWRAAGGCVKPLRSVVERLGCFL